jgi:hypothetical protein
MCFPVYHDVLITGILKSGELKMVHQNSCRFYLGVAYDENYNGLAEVLEEGERIAGCMGKNNVLFMKNHGVVVTGNTVAEAFDRMYFLERACQVQVGGIEHFQDFLQDIPPVRSTGLRHRIQCRLNISVVRAQYIFMKLF